MFHVRQGAVTVSFYRMISLRLLIGSFRHRLTISATVGVLVVILIAAWSRNLLVVLELQSKFRQRDYERPRPLPPEELLYNSTTAPPTSAFSSDTLSIHNISANEVQSNLRIAFIGDSLTRFMYLSLAHYLRWGFWERADTFPSMLTVHGHASWNHYLNFSKFKLFPYEECDCWRNLAGGANFYENRYYWDPFLNNSLTLIQKMGPHPARGHWNVTDVHVQHEFNEEFKDDFAWDYGQNWEDIIFSHLAKLHPKPQYLIFNEGHWQNHGLNNQTTQDSILNALSETGIVGVYKTTTLKKGNERSPYSFHDEELCRKTQYCLNLSWTGQTPDHLYCDASHFYSPVYNQMNVQLLELLGL